MQFNHTTVLLEETTKLIADGILASQRRPENILVADCTLGGAGHTLRLLEVIATGLLVQRDTSHRLELIGCDQDPNAIAVADERINAWLSLRPELKDKITITFLPHNFRALPGWLKSTRGHQKLNGLMADLGVSSPQLDSAERGFSFLREGPLDMRMNTTQEKTARDLLETMSAQDLQTIFSEYGEEPRSKALANAIVKDRSKGLVPLSNTVEFASYVSRVLGYHQSRVHPATRIFQALRIAVNEELAAVEELLGSLPEIMADGARAGFISFHSLEDRLVKQYFRAWENGDLTPKDKRLNEKKRWVARQHGIIDLPGHHHNGLGRESPRGGLVASEEEISVNPRSRSARLRGFHFKSENQLEWTEATPNAGH